MHDTLFNLKPGIDSTSSIAESSTTEIERDQETNRQSRIEREKASTHCKI